MSALRAVVVVGGGAAGVTAAETLRRQGFDGRVTLVCGEPHLPYDRPPLSKQVLSGAWQPDRVRLRDAQAFAELDVELCLGESAVRLDRAGRAVELADGARLRADAVVIATGVRPRCLPGADRLAGAFVLRTVEDASALREVLNGGPRLVVVGAGLLGTEVAAAARGLGVDVTLVSSRPLPLERTLGAEVAGLLADTHRGHGVRLRAGRAVAVEGAGGRVTGVRLEDGAVVPADAVLAATGSEPNVEWLAGSGLSLANGVVCDAACSAGPGVWAAGDIACWPHPATGRMLRLEHRTNATEQAIAAVRNLLAGPAAKPFDPVPYLWSDQYQLRVQVHGDPAGADRAAVVEGSIAEGALTALYAREGRVCAAVGVNLARPLGALRPLVAARAPWTPEFAAGRIQRSHTTPQRVHR